jgi:hypothetical protein
LLLFFSFFSIFVSNAADSKSSSHGKMAGPEVKSLHGGMTRNKMRSYATYLYVSFQLNFLIMLLVSAWRLVILAKAFLCGFTLPLEATTKIVLQIMPRPLPSKSFPIHCSFIIQSFDIQSELLKVFLNKPRIQTTTENLMYSEVASYAMFTL